MSYIVPIGPYHPALEEPIHAKLYTEGEVIKDAEVFVGYNHRGIEKLATERNAIQTLVLVERVCGICSHSHALTYAMCVEQINGIEVPKRGEYIRVITAELERLHSHLLWLGVACHIIGHDSMFMHIWDERELVMDLLEELSGNRVNYAMVTIGGSRRDIDDELKAKLLQSLDKLKGPMDRIVEIACLCRWFQTLNRFIDKIRSEPLKNILDHIVAELTKEKIEDRIGTPLLVIAPIDCAKDQYGNNLFAKQSDNTKKVDQDRPFQNKCLYILDQNNFPNKLKSSSHFIFSFSVLPKSSYRRLLPKDR